ncbi:unnamed protein product [Phytomonas sp. EM1]|nr:unnamed protein product [Phytomonas sp. EM1]|eukprot:CCW64078.1 unnamed protein product [Phytomonas sp. isolate EM1]
MNSSSLETQGGLGLSKPTQYDLDEARRRRDEAVEAERKSHPAFNMPVRSKLGYDFVCLHLDNHAHSEEKASMLFPSHPLSSMNAKAVLFSQLKFLVNILFRRSLLRSRLQQIASKQKQLSGDVCSATHIEQHPSKAVSLPKVNVLLPVFYREPDFDLSAPFIEEEKDSLNLGLECGIFGGIHGFSGAGAGIKEIPLRSHDLCAYVPKYFPELVIDIANKSREELDESIHPPTPPETVHQEPQIFDTYTPSVTETDFYPMPQSVYSEGPVEPYGQHCFAASSLLASDHRFANTEDESQETRCAPIFSKENPLLIEEAFASLPVKLTRALSEDVLSNSDDEPVEHRNSEKLCHKPVKWAFTPRLNVNKPTCDDSSPSRVLKDVRNDLLDHVMYTFSAQS